MNREAVQNEINSIIETAQKNIGGRNARKQYPASKAQIATLTELGIIELMPNAPYSRTIGSSDAKAVIAEAQDSGKVYGDGYTVDASRSSASKLYTLLNENEVDETVGVAAADVHVGDYVEVEAHTIYGDLRGGAVHSQMHEHQHNGYKHVRVSRLFDDELGGTIVEVEVGSMIDEIPLQYCRKVS